MEIDRILKKEIKEYLIRLILFCVAVKYYIFWFISAIFFATIGFPLEPLLENITERILKLNIEILGYSGDLEIGYDNILFSTWTIVYGCMGLYYLAKIFGIFKKLDKVNFFVALVFIAILSQILVWLGRIDFLMQEEFYKDGIEYSWSMYTLVPAFLFYKFFAFLTKKYPMPFEKIGYYFSIEFYKKLWIKFKKKISKNN